MASDLPHFTAWQVRVNTCPEGGQMQYLRPSQRAYSFHTDANGENDTSSSTKVLGVFAEWPNETETACPLSTTSHSTEASPAEIRVGPRSNLKNRNRKHTAMPGRLRAALWFREAGSASALLLLERSDFTCRGQGGLYWTPQDSAWDGLAQEARCTLL